MASLDHPGSRSELSGFALETTFREHSLPTLSAALRGAVCAYVDAMKADGALVERVIVGMKRIAQRGCIEPNRYSYSTDVPLCEQNETMRAAVSLCVRRYYGVDLRLVEASA